MTIEWSDFQKMEMRVGTVVDAEDFPEAKRPAYRLKIDFGAFGTRKSSAQITKLYKREYLIGRQVVAVTNFAPKQIANFMSECLVLGVVLEDGNVVLLEPERKTANGCRIS
jgi:tRNA-binding protein